MVFSLLTSCKKQEAQEQLSQQQIKDLYQKVGNHHNENLRNILANVQKTKSRNIAARLSTESNMYEQIVDNSYSYIVQNNLEGDIAQTEYYTRIYQDIIHSFINETALDVSDVTYDVRTLCSTLRAQIEATEFNTATEVGQFVDNFFNSHVNQLSNPVDVVSFTSFASTVKSSATFWFNYAEPLSSGRVMRVAARPPWKKLAFWDAVGALKGAWEFGKLGFVLGGGAGAFVVGATGAIFEGSSASAAAYLEDRVENFLGL
jgi:hypothetical protein